MVDVHDHLVPAPATLYGERPHAVVADVGEVHRLDRIVGAGLGHVPHPIAVRSESVIANRINTNVFPQPQGSAAKDSTSARWLADRSSIAGEPLPICADPFLDWYHCCFGGRLYASAFARASAPAVRAATEASPFSRTILVDSAAPAE
jgi:hypothetical protein